MDLEENNPLSSRQVRKAAKQRDRSKFKKTNLAAWENKQKALLAEKLKHREVSQGRVLSISPDGAQIDTGEAILQCPLGGVVKQERSQYKNLLAVGDLVLFEPSNHRIVSIQPRKSVLSRRDHLRKRKEQILAANIDQVLITVSLCEPPLKSALIDRYVIAARKGNMTPIVVVNKIDLVDRDPEEAALYRELVRIYRAIGIRVVPVSVQQDRGLRRLAQVMKGKASVFSGQSGVGKSSLIRAMTGLDLAVGHILKNQKGSHQTSQAQLIPLPDGGWCIDTPGIRSFGVWDLTAEDLSAYFPDLGAYGGACRFPNCTHTHEPSCAVRVAVESGELSFLRYESYLKLFATLQDPFLDRE